MVALDSCGWGRKGGRRESAGLKQSAVQSVTFRDAIVAWGFGLY